MSKITKFSCCVLFVVVITSCLSVQNPNEQPRGYKTYTGVKMAVLFKTLDLVNLRPELPSELMEYSDIVYKQVDNESLKLDITHLKGIKKSAPVLIFIHGGAWKSGQKEDYKVYTHYFAKLGYVTVSLQYRLLPKYHFPDCVEDVKSAVRWVASNASNYFIDAENIALVGGSAGGHLAMLVGYSSDSDKFDCSSTDSLVNTKVKAVIDFYGPVDFSPYSEENQHLVDNFVNQPYKKDSQILKEASPLTYISKDDPPTLIFHGTIDELVPISQSDLLKKELDRVGVVNEYYRLKGWPHAMDMAVPINEYCKRKMVEFLEKQMPLSK